MAKMIVINEKYCLACKTCVIECAMAHSEAGTLAEAVASENKPQARVHVEPLECGAMPLQCRHCQDAPCIAVCPTKAVSRANEESPVLLDQARCIGCKMCMLACPFGVIDLSHDGKAVVKCDLCVKLAEKGLGPACVSSCPTGALTFEEIEAYLRQRRRSATEQLAAGAAKGKEASER